MRKLNRRTLFLDFKSTMLSLEDIPVIDLTPLRLFQKHYAKFRRYSDIYFTVPFAYFKSTMLSLEALLTLLSQYF